MSVSSEVGGGGREKEGRWSSSRVELTVSLLLLPAAPSSSSIVKGKAKEIPAVPTLPDEGGYIGEIMVNAFAMTKGQHTRARAHLSSLRAGADLALPRRPLLRQRIRQGQPQPISLPYLLLQFTIHFLSPASPDPGSSSPARNPSLPLHFVPPKARSQQDSRRSPASSARTPTRRRPTSRSSGTRS
jgi:hypothetical protein